MFSSLGYSNTPYPCLDSTALRQAASTWPGRWPSLPDLSDQGTMGLQSVRCISLNLKPSGRTAEGNLILVVTALVDDRQRPLLPWCSTEEIDSPYPSGERSPQPPPPGDVRMREPALPCPLRLLGDPRARSYSQGHHQEHCRRKGPAQLATFYLHGPQQPDWPRAAGGNVHPVRGLELSPTKNVLHSLDSPERTARVTFHLLFPHEPFVHTCDCIPRRILCAGFHQQHFKRDPRTGMHGYEHDVPPRQWILKTGAAFGGKDGGLH